MADRILTWFIPDGPNPVSLPQFYMDADYEPVALRVYAETVPVTGDIMLDILSGSTSIFSHIASTTFTTAGQRTTTPKTTAVLSQTANSEAEDTEFAPNVIAADTWVKCVIDTLAGAKGVSIHLELNRVED